jgi:Zn-dependent protease
VDVTQVIFTASTWVVPILAAITLHEAAHAYAAWRLGDDTAFRLGRVTFNPIRHVDPLGTVLIPSVLFLTSAPFLFGWAKPVPVVVTRLGSVPGHDARTCRSTPAIQHRMFVKGAFKKTQWPLWGR